MNQKHKLAKISTKDGKEFKYVDLYPITEAGIPRKVMDPEIWNIPEGYYAIETNIKSTLVFRKDYLDLGEDKLISLIESLDLDFLMSFSKPVKLYPVIENDEIPEEALDPKIWNIPEGYYAICRNIIK